jgi:hypothetical protein
MDKEEYCDNLRIRAAPGLHGVVFVVCQINAY